MYRFLPLIVLSLVFSGIGYSKGLWWKVCSEHWNECKPLYLEWKEQKARFAQREVECVRNANSVREMTACLREVRKERRKVYREWKRRFNRKFHQWVREMREKTPQKGKAIEEKPEKVEGNKTSS